MVAREVSGAMAQLALVASGLGVALVSSGVAPLAPPGVAFRPLSRPVGAVGMVVAWNAQRETALTQAVVGIARALLLTT